MKRSPACVVPLRPAGRRPAVDAELVKSAEWLLAAVLAGECDGIVFAASMRAGDFVSDLGGVCLEKPTLARGMLAYVSDQLAMVQHRTQQAGPGARLGV